MSETQDKFIEIPFILEHGEFAIDENHSHKIKTHNPSLFSIDTRDLFVEQLRLCSHEACQASNINETNMHSAIYYQKTFFCCTVVCVLILTIVGVILAPIGDSITFNFLGLFLLPVAVLLWCFLIRPATKESHEIWRDWFLFWLWGDLSMC